MYKKICIVFVIFFISHGVIFGMEQENHLRYELYKGTVSVLSVDNYVVNISNAYQALCKEISLDQNILRMMIMERNKRIKKFMQEFIQKRDIIIHQNNRNFEVTNTLHDVGLLEEEHSLFHINDMDYKPNCCNVMIPFYAILLGITIVTVGFVGWTVI
jgi:hypothetical protein